MKDNPNACESKAPAARPVVLSPAERVMAEVLLRLGAAGVVPADKIIDALTALLPERRARGKTS